ncbi:hypothetical protein OK016_19730 [Vibrio chagasii]|nr:hypothetical protein [Vibrio chagasii]
MVFLAGKVTQNKGVSFIPVSLKLAKLNTIVVSDHIPEVKRRWSSANEVIQSMGASSRERSN